MQVIQGSDAEAKVQALMELAAKGPDIPFRVVFTEREIEQQIERYLAQQPEASYRNVTVTLRPGDAVVSGQVNVSGLWVDATIHADVTARDGKPVVTITQVNLGPIPLPGRVKDDLTKAIADTLVEAEHLPFRFTAITLGTGRITVQGVTR